MKIPLLINIEKLIRETRNKFIDSHNNKLNELINLSNSVLGILYRHDCELEKIHKHIDIVQRDILIALNFVKKHKISLKTNYPIAYASPDHLYPKGTMADDTRYPRFIRKCETLFPIDRSLKFLDLGCSGGGVVLDSCLRGHIGIGLEGSDFSLINQRAEWRLLKDNLFTCDITKDFILQDEEENQIVQFDVISAWEVLEHLHENTLDVFFNNIKKHLKDDGYFIASVSLVDDINPETNVNWHCTVKPKDWWYKKIEELGFRNNSDLFSLHDFARGSGNSSIPWDIHEATAEMENSFHIVLTKNK